MDACDLLIGIFWTRIGSPTGIAPSGTIEEIERATAAGKPVMLYFSGERAIPDEIDLDQLKALRDFRQKVKDRALFFEYVSLSDFQEKFARQLNIKVQQLMADTSANNASSSHVSHAPKGAEILLEFADPESGARLGTEITLDVAKLTIPDFESIPDYPVAIGAKDDGISGFLGMTMGNRDYYRQMGLVCCCADVVASA